MEILISLGINGTLWYQLGLFLVGYAILYFVVFRPYFEAFQGRVASTEGQTQLAEKYISETTQLKETYDKRMKELNSQLKRTYERARLEATQAQDQMLQDVRREIKASSEAARKEIGMEYSAAATALKSEIHPLADQIRQTLIGKGGTA